MEEKKDKGFTIKDKRIFSEDGYNNKASNDTLNDDSLNKTQPGHQDTSKTSKHESPHQLPELNFSSFVLSLSSSALFHFGEIPDPVSNIKQRNLPMAKQTIDILGIIKEKTAGNLTKDEAALIEHLLHDLRIRYVDEINKEKA
jgi:hypothetical protein